MAVCKNQKNLTRSLIPIGSSPCPFLRPSNMLHLFSIHVLKLQAKEFGVRSKPAAAAFYKMAQLGLST